MGNLHQAVTLITEGQRAFEQGRVADALALFLAAVEADPSLPDPWIDIAAARRATGDESGALEADRKVVELGDGVEHLLTDVVQARARVERSDAASAEAARRAAEHANRLAQYQISRARIVERVQEEIARLIERQEPERRTVVEFTSKFDAAANRWYEITGTPAPTLEVMFQERGSDRLWQEHIGRATRRIKRRQENELMTVWSLMSGSASRAGLARAQVEKLELQAEQRRNGIDRTVELELGPPPTGS